MLGLRRYKGTAVDLFQGDITLFACDAIVNAANSQLQGGGGVDGAIHRAGGPRILEECRQIGGCPTGEVVATTAGQLPAKWVFHAVGPIWQGGQHGEAELLGRCYRTSLQLAHSKGAEHVSFPSISTGVYGYPIAEASRVAMQAVKQVLDQGNEGDNAHPMVRRITFILFSLEDYRIYQQALFDVFPE